MAYTIEWDWQDAGGAAGSSSRVVNTMLEAFDAMIKEQIAGNHVDNISITDLAGASALVPTPSAGTPLTSSAPAAPAAPVGTGRTGVLPPLEDETKQDQDEDLEGWGE